MAIIAVSFGVAAALGVVRFPGPGPRLRHRPAQPGRHDDHLRVVFLGEEIGWRGYLRFRLAELTSGRRAALLTGAFHAIFHLTLLLLTTTYQNAGNRWIVVPTVMVTLTLAGAWYGWLRLWSGSIWPVSLSHSAFNSVIEGVAGVPIATSPETMAYVTTETGVATMIIIDPPPWSAPHPSRRQRGPCLSAAGQVKAGHSVLINGTPRRCGHVRRPAGEVQGVHLTAVCSVRTRTSRAPWAPASSSTTAVRTSASRAASTTQCSTS